MLQLFITIQYKNSTCIICISININIMATPYFFFPPSFNISSLFFAFISFLLYIVCLILYV